MSKSQDYLVFKFTTKENEYLNKLSEITGMPKNFLINRTSLWLLKNNNDRTLLDFSSDYDAVKNPWKTKNIYCTVALKQQLKQQAEEMNVTRYELVRALIKKVPELIKSGEMFDCDMNDLSYHKVTK